LLRGLRVLQKQEKNANLKNILGELAVSIEGGSTFSEALAQHPKVFNRLFVNMVKAGEIGGVLEVVLKRLSEFMEKAQKIKGKVIAAMFYPCAVMVVATAIMGVLMVVVIPKFKEIFPGHTRRRPGTARFTLSSSASATPSRTTSAGGPCWRFLVSSSFSTSSSAPNFGRRLWDKFKLIVPVFGPVISKVAISRFTRTLGTWSAAACPFCRP
jgi:type IV pilus assembly protein PilC